MGKYVLKNNAQKYRSVRTPTDREILESENNKVTISVLQLPRGIYVSKYVVNGIVESTKKIILD